MPGRGKVEVRVLSAEETWEKQESHPRVLHPVKTRPMGTASNDMSQHRKVSG